MFSFLVFTSILIYFWCNPRNVLQSLIRIFCLRSFFCNSFDFIFVLSRIKFVDELKQVNFFVFAKFEEIKRFSFLINLHVLPKKG